MAVEGSGEPCGPSKGTATIQLRSIEAHINGAQFATWLVFFQRSQKSKMLGKLFYFKMLTLFFLEYSAGPKNMCAAFDTGAASMCLCLIFAHFTI